MIKTIKVDEALNDEGWFLAMQEEIHKFQRNDVQVLVPRTLGKKVIGTKWLFRNKLNGNGEMVRNKARLVIVTVIWVVLSWRRHGC